MGNVIQQIKNIGGRYDVSLFKVDVAVDFIEVHGNPQIQILRSTDFWVNPLDLCSPELGRTSAVCIVTLLAPHGPDLIPRGHCMYCKGGAP